MTTFRTILTREAERVWKDGKDKNKKKLEHLERKWRNNPRPEVERCVERTYIQKVKMSADFAFQSKKICGISA